jgi:hypothetical protein
MSIVIRRVPATALLLIAAYVVGVSTPCPPNVESGSESGRAETRLVHSHGSDASAEVTVLSADCACGCGKRPSALGGRIGVALATQTVEAVAPPISDVTFNGFDLAHAPDPPVRAIDHVPLPT